MMSKGNDNGALKLLTENMSNEIFPLTGKTLKMLKPKHPGANEPLQEVVLQGPIRPVHPTVYEDMNEFLIFNAAMLTKGGSGPSGLDAVVGEKSLHHVLSEQQQHHLNCARRLHCLLKDSG